MFSFLKLRPSCKKIVILILKLKLLQPFLILFILCSPLTNLKILFQTFSIPISSSRTLFLVLVVGLYSYLPYSWFQFWDGVPTFPISSSSSMTVLFLVLALGLNSYLSHSWFLQFQDDIPCSSSRTVFLSVLILVLVLRLYSYLSNSWFQFQDCICICTIPSYSYRTIFLVLVLGLYSYLSYSY